MGNIVFKISEKVDGKSVNLNLTKQEVEYAISVCESSALTEVIVMKKINGSALCYADNRNALAAMERHGYEAMFTVDITSLKASIEPKKQAKDA